jgi:hypothetical protein
MATMISKSSLRDSYQDVSGMLTANKQPVIMGLDELLQKQPFEQL